MTYNQSNTTKKYIWLALFIVFALFSVSTFFVPLVLGDDPAFGFNVWQSMQSGSDFNTLLVPEAHSLSLNKPVFVSWWSPGQYLMPVFVAFVTHLSFERSSLLITILFTVLGLWGWYKIFRYQQYNDMVIAWTLFFILTSRVVTANHFLNYVGGEMLFFGGSPWFLFYFLKYKDNPVRLFLGLLPISLFCFFLKTSSSIVLLSICAVPVFEFLSLCLTEKKITAPNRHFWVIISVCFFSFMVYYLLLNHFYLDKGTNPTSYLNPKMNLGFNLGDLFNFPIHYWTALSDILHQLHFNYAVLESATFWPHLLINIASILLLLYVVITAWKNAKMRTNVVFFVGFYCVYVVFLGYYFTRVAEISFDARHFKILAFLFMPILLQTMAIHKKIFNALILLFLITNTLYSSIIFVIKKYEIAQYPLSNHGYALKLTDQPCIDILHRIDSTANKNKLIFIDDSALAVDVVNCRKIIAAHPYEFSCKVGTSDFDGCYVSRTDTVYGFIKNTPNSKQPMLAIFHNAKSQLIAKTASHSIYKIIEQ